MDNITANAAVTATLDALYVDIAGAMEMIEQALELMKDGNRDGAVGTLTVADPALRRSNDLMAAILAVHQAAR